MYYRSSSTIPLFLSRAKGQKRREKRMAVAAKAPNPTNEKQGDLCRKILYISWENDMPNCLTTEAKNLGIFLTSYPKKAFFGWLSSFPLPPLWVFTSPLSPPSPSPLSFHTHTHPPLFPRKERGIKVRGGKEVISV